MICENFVIEYISDEDSDYSPGESSDDSLEDESDGDVSMEMISAENIIDYKRISIPSEVELWIPMASDLTDEDQATTNDEDQATTIQLLAEDIDSSEDQDYMEGESSDDSLEYETDEEISLETISAENIVASKRVKIPCDVEIWSQLEGQSTSEESDEETDESADESEEETATTMEMLCENLVIEYISDEDSDYSLDESSEDSMEEESDEDVSMEMMSTENILETKRIPVPSEVDLWILKLDASESTDEDEMAIESDETTAAMLTEASLFGYESNNDSDFHADDDGSEDSTCLSFANKRATTLF